MKVVLLAGGLGTRLREETEYRPKPMVEIGGRPILWHIMKIYASYGYHEFIVCLGYKGDFIRDYFLNYRFRNCDFTVSLNNDDIQFHDHHGETDWRVTLAATGDNTATGGRIKRIKSYLGSEPFMVSYGDGVADINVARLLAVHCRRGKHATVTAVRPNSRFGELSIQDGMVNAFHEKPQIQEGWINGGFFIFEHPVLDLIEGDHTSLEADVVSSLAATGELAVYFHQGFWQCMDTYREMELLNDMWRRNAAPWAVWRTAAQNGSPTIARETR